jgi:hypothetical protein
LEGVKVRRYSYRLATIVYRLISIRSVVQIIPLSGNVDDLFTKKRYSRLFDHAFVSSQQCHTLQPPEDLEQQTTASFTNILKDGAAVDVESSVYVQSAGIL